MGCFFRNRVWRGNRKTRLSRMQVSDLGYNEYFHMSRANKLSRLRGPLFSLYHCVSDMSKYSFFRCSDYAKWKVKQRKPFNEWEKLFD